MCAASPVPPPRPLADVRRGRSGFGLPGVGLLPSACPTEAPRPRPRKCRTKGTARRTLVYILGTVARAGRPCPSGGCI